MAQVTVTAQLNDTAGSNLTNTSSAFVRFKLRNYQGFVPRVAGTAIVAETQIDATPNGSGAISQLLWPNNQLTPSSTFYTIEFWNQGRITSSGNYLINANTDLDTAAQLNTPPVPAGFSLVLENNSVLNSSQSTLNLMCNDASVTITDLGSGNINLQAATSGVLAGTPIIALPSTGPGGGTVSVLNIGTSFSVVVVVSGRSLQCMPSKWKMTISPNSATVQVVSMNIAKCTQDTGTVISSTPITFGGQAAPLLSAGANTSDTISLLLDPSFDYYVRLRVSTGGLMNELVPKSGCLPPCTNTYTAAADVQSSNPIVLSGGTDHPGQSLIFNWTAA